MDQKYTKEKINNIYISERQHLLKSVENAKNVSERYAGIYTENERMVWASALFTRIVVFGISFLKILPDISTKRKERDHWDLSTVSSISRNIYECYLMFFYMAIDNIDSSEWEMRWHHLCLRDNFGRWRMFVEFDQEYSDVPEFQKIHQEISEKISSNTFFQSLPEKKRKELLRGDKDHMTQDEIISKLGWDRSQLRGAYRFFSAHTHSSPMSFFRTLEENRGRGVESDTEKGLMIMPMSVAIQCIDQATEDMEHLFGKLAILKKHTRRNPLKTRR